VTIYVYMLRVVTCVTVCVSRNVLTRGHRVLRRVRNLPYGVPAVEAARALLLSLLGPDAASNATVVRPLMPPGTDPCTPAADDWAAWAAVNTPGTSDAAAAWAAKGACGPQWSIANATASTTNSSGGSWRRSRRLHDFARRLLQPGSGSVAALAASMTVPAGAYVGGPPACAWKWLSCSNWRIVAV
jgi:hypothetical protein